MTNQYQKSRSGMRTPWRGSATLRWASTRRGAEETRRDPDQPALLAGRRRGRLRSAGWTAGRRPGGDRQLSRQGAHRRELRQDLDKAYSLIPGRHRLNLHAIYAETGGKQGRAQRAAARALRGLGRLGQGKESRPRLQPDPLLASHGRQRSHPGQLRRGHPHLLDRPLHRLPRRSASRSGASWARPCVTNIWIADGFKDTPVDRKTPARCC